MILRSQKNGLFDLLLKEGFNPTQFDFVETDGTDNFPVSTCISFKDTNYYFTIYENGVYYTPDIERMVANIATSNWNSKKDYFHLWLKNLRYENDIPDKWQEFIESIGNIELKLYSKENTPFTYEQVVEIEQSIVNIKNNLLTIELPPEQLNIINTKLDYLSERAKNIGKIDWSNILLGIMFTIMYDFAKSPEMLHQIIQFFKMAFVKILLIGFRG
ncbi:MAG: hypothetical protein Q7W05_01185 [Deltaproteobacteria bacterium]|nr:hypothetical protein [Deltaproteobacteria bacterium]